MKKSYFTGAVTGLLLASNVAAADLPQVTAVADYLISHGQFTEIYPRLKCYSLEIDAEKLKYRDGGSVRNSGLSQKIGLDACLLDDKKTSLSVALIELDKNNRHYKMTMVQDGNVNSLSMFNGKIDALVNAKIEEVYVGSVSKEGPIKNVKIIDLVSKNIREEAQSLYDRVISAVYKYITTSQ